jgi:hypothetical protein
MYIALNGSEIVKDELGYGIDMTIFKKPSQEFL